MKNIIRVFKLKSWGVYEAQQAGRVGRGDTAHRFL
jgi:hypothetical protein